MAMGFYKKLPSLETPRPTPELVILFYTGRDVPVDYNRAFRFYRWAAEGGHLFSVEEYRECMSFGDWDRTGQCASRPFVPPCSHGRICTRSGLSWIDVRDGSQGLNRATRRRWNGTS